MWFQFKQFAAIAASIAALYTSSAHALPITYQGTLQSSISAVDNATADSGPFGDASAWRFWQFDAIFGQPIQITVQRLVGALDPVFGVWFGTETDSDNYFADMTSSSLLTTLMGFADDEIPPNVAGFGGDAFLHFIAPATGTYVIAVADHSFDPTVASDLRYRIALAISEPGSMVLAAAALGALGIRRRRN